MSGEKEFPDAKNPFNEKVSPKTKLWCSVCKEEYEGKLQDGSYFDEDYHIFRSYPDAFAVHSKCGLSTGINAMEEHFDAVNKDGEGIRNLKEALQEAETNFEKLYDFRENDLKIILDEMERGCYKSQNELFRAVIDSFDGKMNWKRLQWSGSLLNVSLQEKLEQAKKDLINYKEKIEDYGEAEKAYNKMFLEKEKQINQTKKALADIHEQNKLLAYDLEKYKTLWMEEVAKIAELEGRLTGVTQTLNEFKIEDYADEHFVEKIRSALKGEETK